MKYILQIIDGLEYIYDNNVSYLNLKPENIFIEGE